MGEGVVEHYGPGLVEDSRLSRTPHGRLEFLRTQELIRRWVSTSAAHVLDVGGGTGVHAAWLAQDGHRVHVVDVVAGHVEFATGRPGVSAEVGDARDLPVGADSVDVVLLLGPLYHLRDAADRALALAEARRVLRPSGLLVAAGISRYLTLLELGSEGRLSAAMERSITRLLTTGDYDGHAGFVPAHFHTAEELAAEVHDAGWTQVSVYGVEGPTWPALDVSGLETFDAWVEAALRCARLVEQDPNMINASAHLLALAR